MRIAIVGMTYLPGNNGQAIFTIHLAEGLARAGHDVHVITPGSHFRYEHEVVNGVHIHYLASLGFNWLHPGAYLSLFPIPQIRAIFEQYRPDVIHIQDHYFQSRDVLLVARHMGIPMMGTNHFLPENVLPYLQVVPLPRSWKIRIMWALMLWTYDHLEVVTTPTETAAQILRQQRIHVQVQPVSCGVDTCHFHPDPSLDRAAACRMFNLDPEKVLFLYVGRLDREKRIDLLLRGLARLSKIGGDQMQLAIGGQGAAGDELRGLAHTLGLGDQVRFLGYVPNEALPILYQVGQIFCMPSPEELQSIASLEAMASGLPILAANARALPELVLHKQNGYLFDSGQVGAVADGMNYLCERRQEWERMGKVSRSRAEMHSLENTIRKYEDLYCQVTGIREPVGVRKYPLNTDQTSDQEKTKYTKNPV